MPDEDLIRAEATPVRASRRRVGAIDVTAAGQPAPSMGWVSVSGATMPRKLRAGRLMRPTRTVCTQRNSSPPPMFVIAR